MVHSSRFKLHVQTSGGYYMILYGTRVTMYEGCAMFAKFKTVGYVATNGEMALL